MRANGHFEIKLEPRQDESNPAGRMIINKRYSGSLTGIGIGQMISKRTENGQYTFYLNYSF